MAPVKVIRPHRMYDQSVLSRLFALVLPILLLAACGTDSSRSGGDIASASTTLGPVRGFEEAGIVKFLGVPFAKPPTGTLRFRAPVTPDPWTDTFEATESGPACMQPKGYTLNANRSEDCLTLNVWTPAADRAKRPVMVWIHGGGWVAESSSSGWYDGTNLARCGDVVVVGMEYRLGAFGFSYLDHRAGAVAGSGNVGILDQLAALEWVQHNIVEFGGDPENVTVFGESAGGMSVSTLLGIPSSLGLFSKAIVQSGAVNTLRGVEYGRAISDRLMVHAGVDSVSKLQMLSADQLLAAQVALAEEEPIEDLIFGPVIDGVVLPEPPLDAVAAGGARGIPVLIGTTLDEARLWTTFLPVLLELPPDIAVSIVPYTMAIADVLGDRLPSLIELYSSNRPGVGPGDVTLALATEVFFRMPSIRLAEALSANQSATWMYLFTWPTPIMDGFFGAMHGVELPFVFHNYEVQDVIDFIGADPPLSLGIAMQDAWLAFARSGNPNHPGMVEWPAYDTNRRATMILDDVIRVEEDPYGDERATWDGLPFNSVVPTL